MCTFYGGKPLISDIHTIWSHLPYHQSRLLFSSEMRKERRNKVIAALKVFFFTIFSYSFLCLISSYQDSFHHPFKIYFFPWCLAFGNQTRDSQTASREHQIQPLIPVSFFIASCSWDVVMSLGWPVQSRHSLPLSLSLLANRKVRRTKKERERRVVLFVIYYPCEVECQRNKGRKACGFKLKREKDETSSQETIIYLLIRSPRWKWYLQTLDIDR